MNSRRGRGGRESDGPVVEGAPHVLAYLDAQPVENLVVVDGHVLGSMVLNVYSSLQVNTEVFDQGIQKGEVLLYC